MEQRERLRNLVAFWLLGFLNNVVYVVNNASADSIAPGEYGLTYLCSIGWCLLVKMSGPYWFHYVSYKQRIFFAGICCILDFVLVNYGSSPAEKLVGVSFGSVQSGLGEATILALAAFYKDPALCLVMWSSGTGFAGPGGYILSLFIFVHLSTLWATLVGSLLPLCYVFTFFFLLEPPWIDNVRGKNSVASSRVTTTVGETQKFDSYRTITILPKLESRNVNENTNTRAASNLKESLLKKPEDDVPVTEKLTCKERFVFIAGLWPYMVPLFLVYWSEYSIQAGAWSTVAFNPSQIAIDSARNQAYKYLNLLYQCGVFFSRSFGSYLKANLCTLWIMPMLQVGFLIFFILNAAGNNYVKGWILLLPAFCVGLIGGAVYVNAYCMLTRDFPKKLHELALSSTSQADSIGIMLSNICSLYIQWCLFKANGIEEQAGGTCPNFE